MSITSLTAVASGDITNTSSALMFMVSSGTAYKVPASTLPYAANGTVDMGAMWLQNSEGGGGTYDCHRFFGSLAYDTGSWTNANCIGMFIVPDDKWEYVQVGLNTMVKSSTFGYYWTWFMINAQLRPFTAQAHADLHGGTAAFGPTVNGVSAPIKVSSGDRFFLQSYLNGVVQRHSSISNYETHIWIRPYARRIT